MNRLSEILHINRESIGWYFLLFFFLLAFSYFCFFGGYILFFQEQQSLFIYSSSYLRDFLSKPGGLLDLSGKFLVQFYINDFIGSVVLAAVLTLPAIILSDVNKRLIPGSALSHLLLLIPACLLLLMQTHYYHLMMYNLGFVLVLLYFRLSLISEKKINKYLMLVLFPLFFYLTGAYAVIFSVIFIIYSLLYVKGPQKYYYPFVLLLEASISSLLFKEILFLQSFKQLVLFPLPFINNQTHKVLFYLLTGYLILYPVLCRLAGSVKQAKLNLRPVGIIMTIIVFSSTLIMLIAGFNSQTARVINLEKLVFEEKWDDAIKYQEKYPSENMIGQYFYNIALSETDQLCDRLFYGRQDFGTGSLMLEWSSEHLNWGAYSFYTTGLINEAQRWAYEEMVVYGRRPQNLQLLIKTSLIDGNYRMAGKYTGILRRTLFYRKRAREYEKMTGDTSVIRSHPELLNKMRILPRSEFFVSLESPQDNLPMLVESNRNNKAAFEYLMSWLLLEKNVELIVNNIRMMKGMGFTRIPRHIEEAIMIYYNSQRVMPDLGGLEISSETRARFSQYFAAYVGARQNPALLKQKMQKQFGNTFWYYFHFK